MPTIQSINPYNGELLESFEQQSDAEIEVILNDGDSAFNSWRKTSINERAELMNNAAKILRANPMKYAKPITLEMGKPISEAKAEVEKCAVCCDFYAEKTQEFLAVEEIPTVATKSYTRFDPIGLILAVMPWNYPLWQVMRFAAPAIMAGNTGVLKHASNVSRSALLLQELFEEAGIPKGVFQTILAGSGQVKMVIEHPAVRAVTLTGSEYAGMAVASAAGASLKKTVLELGGNNAVIVFKDADIEAAANIGVMSRFMNTGQSCIAGKRFIVLEDVYEDYLQKFTKKLQSMKLGDPLKEDTDIGCLARENLAIELEGQVQKTLDQGAVLHCGGIRNGAAYSPTILTGVTPDMTSFNEELFGPVASFTTARDEEEAIRLANLSRYGLGASLFTQDMETANKWIPELDVGAVFVNELVKSDVHLPFGGVKMSGYGREMSCDGMYEFMNKKTVYVK